MSLSKNLSTEQSRTPHLTSLSVAGPASLPSSVCSSKRPLQPVGEKLADSAWSLCEVVRDAGVSLAQLAKIP